MFLFRDGLLTLINIDSFISLERFCSSLPTTVKLLIVVESKRFCLTLLGEARLWYQSLEPINVNWEELQNLFMQQ